MNTAHLPMLIITGPAESGKSTYVKEHAKTKKSPLIMDGTRIDAILRNKYSFEQLTGETDLLVFDDVPLVRLNRLINYLMPLYILANYKGKASKGFYIPETIITCCCKSFKLPKGVSYTNRFSVVKIDELLNK